MRHELPNGLLVGGVHVSWAVEQVEQEVKRWKCLKYTHITRAISVTDNDDAAHINMETIFSKPVQDCPVPIAVVCVYFKYDTRKRQLTYQFEQENVRHEVGGSGLAAGMFESWLDRIIHDKLQVRRLHDLATPFEKARLTAPIMQSEPELDEEEGPRTVVFASEAADGSAMAEAEDVPESQAEMPLHVLLSNIFDAADEESEYELTHKEVADLLYATSLGLADWDIKLLLTTATELETGGIQYQPFVQSAPDIIKALLKRRAAYEKRISGAKAIEVTIEAIDLCYGEEIEDVTRAAREAFASADTTGKGSLSRYEFRTCLTSKAERFSRQEVQMLMQMCKEDDFGQVPYDEIGLLLQKLRVDALHNALVETDVASLRIHLILLIRRQGLTEERIMPVWNLRDALLSADQLCLSRMQIHTIISIIHPNSEGDVDVDYFLRVCCTVIPSMFDRATFMDKAATIKSDKEAAQAKQELEELQGISANIAQKRRNEEKDEEDQHPNAPDRDAVEKALIQVGNHLDEKHRAQPTLEVFKFLEAMEHESVQACQLADHELRGFIAEANVDERGEIAYMEHVKTWVPIIFELRRSHIYDQILAMNWGLNAPHLVDLSGFEEKFPLIAGIPPGSGSRMESKSSDLKPERRGSFEKRGSLQALDEFPAKADILKRKTMP